MNSTLNWIIHSIRISTVILLCPNSAFYMPNFWCVSCSLRLLNRDSDSLGYIYQLLQCHDIVCIVLFCRVSGLEAMLKMDMKYEDSIL